MRGASAQETTCLLKAIRSVDSTLKSNGADVCFRETKGTNTALARQIAEDLDVDEVNAEFVIRDGEHMHFCFVNTVRSESKLSSCCW